jgi:hypothetical protein
MHAMAEPGMTVLASTADASDSEHAPKAGDVIDYVSSAMK